MSSDNNKIFEKSWRAILEFGFNRLQCEENNLFFSCQDIYTSEYEAVSAAASEICKIISADTDNLTLVEKTCARVRMQVELFLARNVLRSVRARKKQGLLLEALSEEWEKFTKLKDWLAEIFSGLNKFIREHSVLEDHGIFETERIAAECFSKVIFSPYCKRFGEKMAKRFKSHIICMTPTVIDADIALFGGIKILLEGISYPGRNTWSNFGNWFLLPRTHEYHRMASNWVKSLCFEDFVSCIIRYSERESIAAQTCFDHQLAKGLRAASIKVFFGKYLPKVFRKNKEQYKTWVREGNISPLLRINKAIACNADLAEEVTEIFRVCFLERICSALNIDCAHFMAYDEGRSRSPLHAYCPNSRKEGRVLRQEVLCMEKVTETMLDSFRAHANLLKAFSTERYLLYWCEKVLESHVTPCKKCLLPEALLSFCKSVLLNHGRTDASARVYSCHSKVLLFMKYVPKPEQVRRVYIEDLYKRITEGRLASDAAERVMLSAFSGSDENSLIRKGMRMLGDHTQSRKLLDLFFSSPSGTAFQEQNTPKVALRVNLFLNGTIKRRRPCLISVPRVIQGCHQSYENFFKTRLESANLEWNYILGTVTVETRLFCNVYRERTKLELSVEQYSVLNLFQDIDCIPLRSVVETIVMPPPGSSDRERTLKVLSGVILSMMTAQCPLLRKNPADNSILAETDTLMLNTIFKSDRSEIKLPAPIYGDASQIQTIQQKHSNTTDLICIESAISIIMKDLRRASRERLFSLVSDKVAKFHELNEKTFDICIERLIEREYIAREEGLAPCFAYIL